MRVGARWDFPLLGACMAGVLVCSACRKHRDQTASLPASSTQAQPTSFNATMMEGADRGTLQAYLKSVHEVKPKKFEVHWSDSAVAVSREEALRSLHSVSRDGNSYTFAASEPVVQKLQPGRIVWIWGIAIARIDHAATIDSETTIHTVPVSLSEALPRSDIEFEAPVDFRNAISRIAPKPTTPDSAWKMVTARPVPSLFRQVTYRPYEGLVSAPTDTGEDDQNADSENPDEATADSDLVAGQADGYHGDILGWEYSMGYTVTGDRLRFDLEGRKMEEGAPAGASNEISRDERWEFFEYVAEQRHAEKEAEEAHERMVEDQEKLAYLNGLLGPTPPPTSPQEIASLKSQGFSDAAIQKIVNADGPQDKATREALEVKRNLNQADLNQVHKQYLEEEEMAELKKKQAENLARLKSRLRNVFFIVNDNLDVRFRATADLDPLTVAAALITSSAVGKAMNAGTTIVFKGLKGSVDLEYVARLGEAGTGDVNIPVAHIPVIFNVPIIVEGVPFIVQVGGDFLFKVGLSGKHAAHHFHAKFTFDGEGGGFAATSQSQTNTNFNLSGSEPDVEETTAESPGVSGAVLAVQIPRVGLGLGLWGIGLVGYVDQVVVVTMTNSAGVATLNPTCKRVTIDRDAHIGADLTTMMPIPVLETLTHFIAWKKEVWKAPQWKRVDPDIPFCRI